MIAFKKNSLIETNIKHITKYIKKKKDKLIINA